MVGGVRNERMGPVEWALLAVLALVWGSAFFFYKLLDQAQLPPFTIVAGRVGVAALVLVPVVLLSGRDAHQRACPSTKAC